ncbi:MAG TPA: NADH-quinone oxidoreductase subunit L [Deltaproteobacteria bacterium]|nr:NADH-quinone oxidoreductase subunit L [Deltaproteobacteria bacterium]
MSDYIWLIPTFPFLGFIINGLFGRGASKNFISWIACLAIFCSFCVSATIFYQFLHLPPTDRVFEKNVFDWIVSGDLSTSIGFRIDALSIIMCLVVSGVGFLIHVYSAGYMHDDPGFRRYFTYLNLFVFMMLILVTANNILLMFVGWEGVGLCSYLLIGFWYKKDSASNAGKKAFIVNRIGDFGFLLGVFMLLTILAANGVWTLNFGELEQHAGLLNTSMATLVTLLFFVGATGKSAQIPLYVWLPDAMEGPTPVSSLIHAATMVTAGVYMIARLNFLYNMAPITMFVVALVGVLTALFAASIGFAQYDIKRVLAYSTVSQLGFMFVGVGVGAYAAGIFHLMTHAFFKGLLFLGAGSVMHAMSGELDMRKMGGLWKKIPITWFTFLMACIAIAGIPPFSGFFSKDEILWRAFSSGGLNRIVWLIGSITAGMTAFYMFRLLFVTFHGECRAPEEVKHHIHESPKVMTIPLMILAFLSIVGGWVGIPHLLGGSNHIEKWMEPIFGHGAAAAGSAHAGGAFNFSIITNAFASEGAAHGGEASVEMALMILAVAIGLLGIFIAYLMYIRFPALPGLFVRKFHGLFVLVNNKYWVDEIYHGIFVRGLFGLGQVCKRFVDEILIDGTVNGIGYVLQGTGSVVRLLQSGRVQGYAFGMMIGAVAVLGYLVLRVLL